MTKHDPFIRHAQVSFSRFWASRLIPLLPECFQPFLADDSVLLCKLTRLSNFQSLCTPEHSRFLEHIADCAYGTEHGLLATVNAKRTLIEFFDQETFQALFATELFDFHEDEHKTATSMSMSEMMVVEHFVPREQIEAGTDAMLSAIHRLAQDLGPDNSPEKQLEHVKALFIAMTASGFHKMAEQPECRIWISIPASSADNLLQNNLSLGCL